MPDIIDELKNTSKIISAMVGGMVFVLTTYIFAHLTGNIALAIPLGIIAGTNVGILMFLILHWGMLVLLRREFNS